QPECDLHLSQYIRQRALPGARHGRGSEPAQHEHERLRGTTMNDRTKGFRVAKKSKGSSTHKAAKTRRQRGIALFTSLLLLSLVSLLGLAMVLSVNSDMLINGYYGNYRGSFYAADSGLSIARQALLNTMSATVNTTPCVGWGAA